MSDYLWDKQGDTDAEVARLEAMLGAFAHEPRPLELPAGAAAPEPRRSWLSPFASRLFAPAALAAAAAVLVAASVIVASLLLRSRVATEENRAAAPGSSRPKEEPRKDERPAPREAGRATSVPAPEVGGVGKGVSKVESAAAGSPPNVARLRKAAQPSAAVRRRPKDLNAEPPTDGAVAGGLNLETMGRRGGASGLVENARLLTKEQLVYALRFTGAKLKDVREKAQGTQK